MSIITQTAEYALRAMVCLASAGPEALTSQQVAERTGVSQGYLVKVLQRLCRNGLVLSQRGPHGGFVLSRAADQINLLDVINAVDPLPHFNGSSELLQPLNSTLNDAIASVEHILHDANLSALSESHSV